MFRGQRVAVVVPAFNEEHLVGTTLATIPGCVDAIYVVDDASTDATSTAARMSGEARVRLIRHDRNRGVGGAIVTGYRAALTDRMELVVVMAADNQMHPDDLEPLLAALVEQNADYAKGNRFVHPAVRAMPLSRRLAGKALALLTRLATGLVIDDSQCGFTAARATSLQRLDLDDLWPRYGYPNDLLALLAATGAQVVEVPVRPVYASERSGVRPWHALGIAGRIGSRWYRQRRTALRETRLEPSRSGSGMRPYPFGLPKLLFEQFGAQAVGWHPNDRRFAARPHLNAAHSKGPIQRDSC